MPGWVIGDEVEDISKTMLGVDAVSLAVSIIEYIAAARQPPASEPAKR